MKTYKKVLLGLGITAGAGYGLCALADDFLFKRGMEVPDSLKEKISDCDSSHLGDYLQNNLNWVEDYGYEKFTMVSDRGENLRGYLMKPEKDSKVYIFCAHGYRSYGKKEFCGVGQFYIKEGYNVFFPDHVASGESEGKYCTFSHYEVEDCLKWLKFMTDNFGSDIEIILHGVSMGGATVMRMSERALPENVKAIIEDCGFTSAAAFFEDKLRAMNINTTLPVKAINAVNKHRAGFDFYTLSPKDSVKNATLPMLFIHGDKDGLVPSYMVYELYENCKSEKKDILVVEGADHAQAYMVGGESYREKVGGFISEVLKRPALSEEK